MTNPYESLPSYTRWSRAVATPAMKDVDPVVGFSLKLTPEDKVATAGSCFAQHIARHLRRSGFNYYIVERGHPIGEQRLNDEFNYGVFSARYGNIYTAAQLMQLVKRATGIFRPRESPWRLSGGGFVDPFRPTIQPGGFASLAELIADREQHLDAVLYMLKTLDTFVFTFGLTEAWRCRDDGAVLPMCPGVVGGEFSPSKYEFVNFSVLEILRDMEDFLVTLRMLNPAAHVILTVSPVPLIATAEDRHVLVSTSASKSVLRVACDELAKKFDFVSYFPSYEIITGAHTRGRYFAEDLRSVTEEGVEHVMRLFFKHATSQPPEGSIEMKQTPVCDSDEFISRVSEVVKTICDEELLECSPKQ